MSRVTTTDIAREAGVSQTTVSLVLRGRNDVAITQATRDRVMQTAQRMGYRKTAPRERAKTAAKRGTRLIGLLVPNLINLFFTNVVHNVERFTSGAGYEIVVCNIRRNVESEEDKLASLMDKGVDGIIVAYTPRNIENLKELCRRVPVVILGESPTDCGIQTIGINGYRCGEIMAAHLYNLGHRDIALLTAPIGRISLTRPRRIRGATAFLKSKGCAEGLFVLEDTDTTENEEEDIYEFTIGYRLARRLLQSGRRFTAIMCSDMNAPGIYNVLSQHNLRIPEDVSVIGIDNTFVSRILSPALTTIDHHLPERCKLAVEYLTERIAAMDWQGEGYLVEYSPSLVARDSTGPVT